MSGAVETRWLSSALGFAVLTCTMLTAFADEAAYRKIRVQMNKLSPLIGKWNVAATFHAMEGEVREQVAPWSVSSILDDTYLEFQTERQDRKSVV